PYGVLLPAQVAVAEDLPGGAGSGGHTDHPALTALFPTILALKHEIMAHQCYRRPIRVGAAGGLGTPSALAASFSLGAAYVLTGSINQSAVEAGLSTLGKELLTQAQMTDVAMAPAADMFEMGVKVQVLKRGTLFAARAHKLYDVYKANASLEAIPSSERAKLEREILGGTIDEVWASTASFFRERDPKQLE